jgi:hypothetical protein
MPLIVALLTVYYYFSNFEYLLCRDATAIFSEWMYTSCSIADSNLAIRGVYSENCTTLQEGLYDTCCVPATVDNDPEPGGQIYPPCSICFDGSTPLNKYVRRQF